MFPLEDKQYVLGFDPGGHDAFGWSICEVFGDIVLPQRGGYAAHAAEITEKVANYIHRDADILGIGISAPLFWSPTGTRHVDNIVRDTLKARDHPAPSGTVQQLGSLRGASLVQGLLLASYLWEEFKVPITEVHSKAALWLLDPEVKRDQELTEETPDAVVAAFAAYCMHTEAPGWRNIYLEEPNPVLPLGTPVSYWLPIPKS